MSSLRGTVLALVIVGVALGGVATTGAAVTGDVSLIYEGDELTMAAGSNQTIHGQTSLSEGAPLTVRLVSDSPSSPFVRTAHDMVAENGSFTVSVDLSPVQPGTDFNITVLHDGSELLASTGHVVECDRDCTKSTPRTESDDSTTSLLFEGTEPTLAAGPNQAVEGRTDLEPGTDLTVRVQSVSPTNPFLRTVPTTVDEDRSFEATIDLSEMEPETEFTIVVHRDGNELLETTGSVVACEELCGDTSREPRADGNRTSLVYDGEQPTLAAGPGQRIEGRTDLEPGTDLTISVRSVSPGNPFKVTDHATVTDYGTFSTTNNLSQMQPGTSFHIVVTHDETVLLETTGVVVSCDGDCPDTDNETGYEAPTEYSQAPIIPSVQPRTVLFGGSALLGAGVLGVAALGLLLGVFRS